jgi:NAD(P)-dependent dehydrogenase (short-subunit alcohol dehydrogenase family)/acyl dehydratase
MSAHVHPAADLAFGDIATGATYEVERAFSAEDVERFAALSGDWSPLHVDAEYAAASEFGGCVVHGVLLASLFSQLIGMRVPGRRALYLGQETVFRRPVRVGERIRAICKVTARNEATRTITLATEIRDASDRVVVAGSARVKVRDAPGESASPAAAAATDARAGEGRRVALVTGGSGGLGSAVATLLGARGYAVGLCYFRRERRAAAVAAAIREAGGHAMPIQADVRKAEDVERAIASATDALGSITVLVNAATGELEEKRFLDAAWPDFERALEYQVKAVAGMTRAVHPLMKQAGGGAIVNVLSQVVGGAPPANMAPYVVAKYAAEGLTRALAVEFAGDGIRVNAVSPGLVRTDLTEHLSERVFRGEALRTPLKRLATAHDVAQAVAYLAGEESAFVTGTNLYVTGGQVMQ